MKRTFVPGLHGPLEHAHDDHDAAVRVVPGVEDEGLQGGVGVAGRRGQPRDDGLEDFLGAGPLLGARENRAGRVEADDLLDLTPRLIRLRAGKIDLVDDGDDLEVVVDGQVRVGERLRLDALRGIDEQQRALAGRQRTRHLVREIDMARRVDQVEDVLVAVLRLVVQPDRVRLDRDAALALEVHAVEDLGFHLSSLQGAGEFQEPVGQRGLAVVDVRDDGEIANELRIQRIHYALRGGRVQGVSGQYVGRGFSRASSNGP